MSSVPQQSEIDSLRRQFGDWTMHNFALSDGSYTMSEAPCGHEPLARTFTQHIQDVLRRPLAELRIADLGCLEGLYALELAAHGVKEAVGIEIREQSVAKADFVRRDLGLDNCRFVQDDARNFTAANYGRFDAVLCLGLLYHLDAPDIFHLLRQIHGCCDGMLIIDTHVSLFPNKKIQFEGHDYWGWETMEHGAQESDEKKYSRVWASLGNDKSFWLTRASLFNFLERVGFTSVFEVGTPAMRDRDSDRITVVAIPGQRAPFRLRELPPGYLEPSWTENDKKFFADAEHWRLKEQQASVAFVREMMAEQARGETKGAARPQKKSTERPVGPECPVGQGGYAASGSARAAGTPAPAAVVDLKTARLRDGAGVSLPEGIVTEASEWALGYRAVSAWTNLAPWAFWTVEALRPKQLVELGSHNGLSYFAFCQAIAALGLDTRATAVDTWRGDEQTGYYGEQVYRRVAERNAAAYQSFSTLVRDTFDAAVTRFADGSIDLLHIDGRHYYGDVAHDFATWQPKLSARSLVLMHDICIFDRGFGVHLFWDEVARSRPSFAFRQDAGLGLLWTGSEPPPPPLAALFEARGETALRIHRAYEALGNRAARR